ncbi:hypothetical protein [Actinomyces oris]|uniref:hypothetical protein n=1 Tax=Actinomyces oris TaxID=544580 RepID=UPI0028D1FFFD|nr:hypothetical protein [Actinomyces oris]
MNSTDGGPATPGLYLEVTGVSALVRDQETVFFTAIEHVERLDLAQVQFVPDQCAASVHSPVARRRADSCP